jgi:hypothetical protein
VGDAFEMVFGRNFLFNFPRKTFFNLNHFRASGANEMVMVTVVVFAHQFKAPGTVAEIEPLDHPHLFEHVHRAINRGEVALSVALSHFGQDFAIGERVRVFSEDFQDGRARARNFAGLAAQTVF